jgi:hypothetical protein
MQVALDFSNLEAVLQGLLADPQRMQTIADTAYGAAMPWCDYNLIMLLLWLLASMSRTHNRINLLLQRGHSPGDLS